MVLGGQDWEQVCHSLRLGGERHQSEHGKYKFLSLFFFIIIYLFIYFIRFLHIPSAFLIAKLQDSLLYPPNRLSVPYA